MPVQSKSAKARGRDEKGERQELTYRQLRIVAGWQGGRGRAIAYSAGRRFLDSEGADPADAVEALKRTIDAFHRHYLPTRREGVPSPDEYGLALGRVGAIMTPSQRLLLVRHAARPGGRATFRQLAEAVGEEAGAAERFYARLGRLVGDALDFHPSDPDLRAALQPILVLAEPLSGSPAEREWILRASLAVALEAAGEPLSRPRRAG
jgi:hypothetical protein